MFSNNNQIFAAPLAGITDKPFRTIIRKFAPDISIMTEMISCHSLVEKHKNCERNFDVYTDEENIGAQIFGSDIRLMAESAKILQDAGAKWIDINMGCPVPKVATKACAGAFLMKDHVLAGKIIEHVVHAVNIPVSIKTRLGWDSEHCDWQDLMYVAKESGASFATLHGRTRAQGYAGQAILPNKPKDLLPIIANGDIKNVFDINRVQELGYDGAMIGRAMLGQPWIFGNLCKGCDLQVDVGNIVLEHLELVLQYYGTIAGVPLFRKHISWYSSGKPKSTEFRVKVNKIVNIYDLKMAIKDFWHID